VVEDENSITPPRMGLSNSPLSRLKNFDFRISSLFVIWSL